jgi:dsDNA-binding SOS-regulon protein
MGAYAQSAKPSSDVKTALDSLKKKRVNQLKTLSGKYQNKIGFNQVDSIGTGLNSTKAKFKTTSDSLSRIASNAQQRLDSAFGPNKVIGTKKFDSLQQKLRYKMDSLSRLKLPTDKLSRKLDSLQKFNPTHLLTNSTEKIESGINAMQSKVTQKIEEPSKKINEKVFELTKQSDGRLKLPNAVVTKPNIPNINLNIQSKIPDLNSPSNLPSNQNQLIKGAENPLNELNKKVISEQQQLKSSVGLSEETKKIQSYSQDINKELQNIKSTDVESLKQDKLTTLEKLDDELSQAQKQLEDAKKEEMELVKNKNAEAFKEHTLKKGREVALQQFASQEKAIQSTVEQISKYQREKDNIIKQVKGLPKERPPREQVPPLIERFIPGLTLQVDKSSVWKIDINPSVHFRLKKLISVGVGYNERIAFTESTGYRENLRVFGIRNYAEVTIRKGFAIRADIENMNTFVPVSFQQQDVGERKWVWSYLLGAKKSFSFGAGVLGNVQFMYNLYDPNRESPYQNRFNVRFGFEFPLKRKKVNNKN